MQNTKKDIEEFNTKVSSFFGEVAINSINSFYANQTVDRYKKVFYTMSEELPLKIPSISLRGSSNREFIERLSMDDLQEILTNAYDIARPGNIDSIHAFIICNSKDYIGVAYSDLINSIKLVKEHNIDSLIDKIYGLSEGNILGDIDIHNVSFHIFLFAEITATAEKYKHLAYDYSMIQAGAISQNIYINCEDNDFKKCSLGSYSKDIARNEFLRGDSNFICLTDIIIGK